jgi:hypothetical protein
MPAPRKCLLVLLLLIIIIIIVVVATDVVIISPPQSPDFARLLGSTTSLAVLAGYATLVPKTKREILQVFLIIFC